MKELVGNGELELLCSQGFFFLLGFRLLVGHNEQIDHVTMGLRKQNGVLCCLFFGLGLIDKDFFFLFDLKGCGKNLDQVT